MCVHVQFNDLLIEYDTDEMIIYDDCNNNNNVNVNISGVIPETIPRNEFEYFFVSITYLRFGIHIVLFIVLELI